MGAVPEFHGFNTRTQDIVVQVTLEGRQFGRGGVCRC